MSSSVHSDVILLFTTEEQKLMSAQIMYACAGLTGDVSSRRHRLPVLTLADVLLKKDVKTSVCVKRDLLSDDKNL